MARLYPKLSTIKKLFSLSGNECAHYDCKVKLVGDRDVLIGEICHIEAESPEGPRYNKNQSNDARREFDNLIILCANHHKIIDSEDHTYTVEYLKVMKRMHENMFRHVNFEPSTKIITSSIHKLSKNEIPRWLSIASYELLRKIYPYESIKIIESESPHFLVHGERVKSVITQDIRRLGEELSVYELDFLIERQSKKHLIDETFLYLFANSLLDNRNNNSFTLKKSSVKYFYKLSSLIHKFKESGISLNAVFLVKEKNNQYRILPEECFHMLMRTVRHQFDKNDNLDMSTHSTYEKYFSGNLTNS